MDPAKESVKSKTEMSKVRIRMEYAKTLSRKFTKAGVHQAAGAMRQVILDCGHMAVLTSSEDETTYHCKQSLTASLACGHSFSYECGSSPPELHRRNATMHYFDSPPGTSSLVLKTFWLPGNSVECKGTCGKMLSCGHICEKRCHPKDPNHELIENQCGAKVPCSKTCPAGMHTCKEDVEHICGQPCKCPSVARKLKCGHYVRLPCSEPDPDESECKQLCVKIFEKCGHRCKKPCCEECGDCTSLVMRVPAGCSEGHIQIGRCNEPIVDKPCQTLIIFPYPIICGHPEVSVPCHKISRLTPEEASRHCLYPCRKMLDGENECGHQCRGTCGGCRQGRLHVRCMEPCEKPLICGHRCNSGCCKTCSPCAFPCPYACEHDKRCEFECGVPCSWKCDLPCPYECEHSKCTNMCSEVCNKVKCQEPCKKLLACGHQCVGFCGELCPPLCRFCNAEELLAGVFSGKSEIIDEDRFIYLKGCGHCIMSDEMDTWMRIDTESEEIVCKSCPICRQRIVCLRRYSQELFENRKLINSVRKKVFGDVEKIEEIRSAVKHKLDRYQSGIVNKIFYADFPGHIYNMLSKPIFMPPGDTGTCQSLYLAKAQFLEWATDEWITAADTISGFAVEKMNDRAYIMLERMFHSLLNELLIRTWPMLPPEVDAYQKEKLRLYDGVRLYLNLQSENPQIRRIIHGQEARRRCHVAETLLWTDETYSEESRSKFLDAYKDLSRLFTCTLNIADGERSEIVSAFGDRAGRWFKCENGHVYVITECGGAMELGVCNECGAKIGGKKHALHESNNLATEMDGALAPLYPTALLHVGAPE